MHTQYEKVICETDNIKLEGGHKEQSFVCD
jgi:hypothetical protein